MVKMLKRATCPRCGAKTAKQAETMCRPMAIADTGDYDCPGEEHDSHGWILQPTPEWIAQEEARAKEWSRRFDDEAALEAQAIAHDRRMPSPWWHNQFGYFDDYSRLPGVIAMIQPQETRDAQ